MSDRLGTANAARPMRPCGHALVVVSAVVTLDNGIGGSTLIAPIGAASGEACRCSNGSWFDHVAQQMDLRLRVEQILRDRRLWEDEADEKQLIAEYGADNRPEALYLLADKYGWQQLYDLLIGILRDDTRSQDWEIAQIVLFYAASDRKRETRSRPMPADSTIALLYYRFPDGLDDGDRIWSVVCDLKNLEHWSNYDPMHDPDVLRELETLPRS